MYFSIITAILCIVAVFSAIAIRRSLQALQRCRGVAPGTAPAARPLLFWRRAFIHSLSLGTSALILSLQGVNVIAFTGVLIGQVTTVLAVAALYRAPLRSLNLTAARTVVWVCAVTIAAVSVLSVPPLRGLTDFVLSGAKGGGAGGLLALPFAVLLIPVLAALTAAFQLGASLLIIAVILAVQLRMVINNPLPASITPPVYDKTTYAFHPVIQTKTDSPLSAASKTP